MDQKRVLKKVRKKLQNWIPQGSPERLKIDFRSFRMASESGSRGEVANRHRKSLIFKSPGTMKMRLSPRRGPHFHFFTKAPKSSQNGPQIALNRFCWPSQGVPEAFTETNKKTIRKTAPKGAKREPKMDPKIDKKRVPEPDRGQGRSRGGPGKILRCLWVPVGTIF